MLTSKPIDSGALLMQFTAAHSAAGAIVSFTGQVRNHSAQKDVQGEVSVLHLQAYEPMTSDGIIAAQNRAYARWPLQGVKIVHRIGDMKPADTIVFVATAAKHRRAAFEAADFLMDYLKTRAIFWKKEITQSGYIWVEPRAQDYTDAQRWDNNLQYTYKDTL